jgi:histidinol dehydrogenase
MERLKIFDHPSSSLYRDLTIRPQLDKSDLNAIIDEIYKGVAEQGDAYLKLLTKKFDKVEIEATLVNQSLLQNALEDLNSELKDAILLAKDNITKFHQAQYPPIVKVNTIDGVNCVQKAIAIERIGIYIPGGTAPLFSTILMLAVPAKIAGCKEIILCSPPTSDGKINQTILAVAHLCGIDKVYQIGGSQAIAAMALGTESIQKVSKIFGPGNQYVTAAKEKAQQYGVAIDMPAGPSEVLVYADETCDPSFVAADLLSQAEHGIDSQVVLVCTNIELANQVNTEIESQLNKLPRKEIAALALKNSFAIVEKEVKTAFKYVNEYAPEHLIIASEKAQTLSDLVVNAGSVFLGNYCPEAIGDYASGTNHTLPTYGWAKSYNGVNLDTFMRKITYQTLTIEGIQNLGPSVVLMAEAENLAGHANAISIRLSKFKKS